MIAEEDGPMTKTADRLFKASEFARLAGVTVRTLHHYDRLGLLEPSGRTESGYRLYGERDFARLQQIVTLKFIGLPLDEIGELLDRSPLDLAGWLRLQRVALEEKRRQLDLAVSALSEAERAAASAEGAGWEAFARIIEVIEMHKNMDWVKKYYTEEQLAELASRWSPELQERAERDWAALIKDVEEAVAAGEDPRGERGRELAARWSALIGAFTGGDPGIAQNLGRLYADQPNWPASFQKPYGDEVGAFFCEAQKGEP